MGQLSLYDHTKPNPVTKWESEVLHYSPYYLCYISYSCKKVKIRKLCRHPPGQENIIFASCEDFSVGIWDTRVARGPRGISLYN